MLKFSATNTRTGKKRETRQLTYISRTVPTIYLSRDACADLGIISKSFPQVDEVEEEVEAAPILSTQDMGSDKECAAHCAVFNLPKCSNSGVVRPGEPPCRCPTRSLPPSTPPSLPCAPNEENLPQLKQYILERFKASAFNCCEHQVLPLMTGSPPLRLHMDPQVKPTAVYTPSAIPRHYEDDVKAGLDRDERLQVIERVPVNDPATWTSRMLVTTKADGSPRRVIDFETVNKHTPRQTHHTKPPWAIASSVPAGKYKTVLDCSNGYHSVPLHPADRHITTFLTPWGRYRYRTTPQGLNCAGDGYTQRSDLIMEGIKDMARCIDDTIMWTDNIGQNFFKVCDFLTRCSNAGMVFNPSKFQFSEKEVDYVGFRITDKGIRPQEQFLQSVRDFPIPRNITDVRSWFGLINQVSYTFAVAQTMAPFRHLLSSKVPFYWSEELQSAFEKSKEEIIQQCMKGVRTFSLTAPTALATDWSRLATGYWLTQKFCDCPEPALPGCCTTGWQTVCCGSSFNSPAQSRYHPIEGEALAVKTGLEKCKVFLLGHPNLILCVDHKPLLGIMRTQDLAEIPNPRLLDFRIKAMAFNFKPVYVPGKLHVAPDTLSRRSDSPIVKLPPVRLQNPVNSTDNNVGPQYCDTFGPPDWVSTTSAAAKAAYQDEDQDTEELESLLRGRVVAHITAIRHRDEVESITWERLEASCLASNQYRLLHATVTQGVSENSQDWDVQLQPYFRHRQALSTVGPVVLLYERPVIPPSLRQEVMEHLHAAHGCANLMFAKASATMYWPNYREEINKFQAACKTCRKIAPSNPSLPPSSLPELPTYPFESIAADFFSFQGRNYLAIADRYSNWISVIILAKDDATHLIQALREYSTYFGIPRILSSDGAAIFTATEMEEFCRRWGITQRISSAYHAVSNKRAEIGVKSCKRMIRDNLKPDGSLDGDKFARALLIHRNTPDPETGVSPAQIVYGRQLRDHLPVPLDKFRLNPQWEKAAKLREECFLKRHFAKCEDLLAHTKNLPPLIPGDCVYVQDQDGRTPRQWNRSGKILEALPHNSYLVSLDGSYRPTRRNRKFLRKFTPYSDQLGAKNPKTQPDLHVPILGDPVPQDVPVTPQPQPDSLGHQDLVVRHDERSQAPEAVPPETPGQVQEVPETEGNMTEEEANQVQPRPDTQPGDQTPVETEYKKPKRKKPKHLREKWILTPPPEAQRDKQLAASIMTFMQACLEVFNLSHTSARVGGIHRTET